MSIGSRSQDSPVSIVTRLIAGQQRMRTSIFGRKKSFFSPSVSPEKLCGLASLLSNGKLQHYKGCQSGRGVKLTTHYVLQRLRIIEA
jgi:hypothetical protein